MNGGLKGLHKTSQKDIATLILSHPECQGLDDGELHLLAWLHTQKIIPHPQVFISTADKAAIRAAHYLGWKDALISLEELLTKSGASKSKIDILRPHFRNL